jgi:hypothetical protein
MSARELIEQLKRLPEKERAAFASLFHDWEKWGNGAASHSASRASGAAGSFVWPDFEGRMRRLFPDGALPGRPLSEIVSEGRGEA